MLRLRSLVPLAVAAVLATGSLSAASTQVFPLGRGGVERVLAKDTVHAYPVDLRAGEYLSLRVDQRGVDVELRLFDPGGHLLLRLDSPNGAHGPEDLFFFAEKGGRYRLEIGLSSGPPGGRYQIGVRARRPATTRDRRRAAALLASSRGPEASLADDQKAAALWHELGDEGRCANALWRAADLELASGAPHGALKDYQQALQAYRSAGDLWNQALMESRIAKCHRMLGQLTDARTSGEKALAMWRQIGAPAPLAAALQSLGELSRQQGNLRVALGFFQEEEETAKTPEVRARALIALGVALSAVGEGGVAQEKWQSALKLLRGPGTAGLRAQALTQLANNFLEGGSPGSARLALRQAWLALRKSGAMDSHDMAITLASMGRAYFTLGDLQQAKDYHEKALELLAKIGGGLDEGYLWNNLGWILEALNKPQEALNAFQHALAIARARGSRELEAAGLLGVARVERQRNNPLAARARLEEALDSIEAMRDQLAQPDLQISFLAKKEDYYKSTIDLLMEQYRQRPTTDGDQRAFAVSEQSRSRSLLDRLSKSAAGARPLSLVDVQHHVLDEDSLLLEYYLSEPKSYLWVVSSKTAASFELAGRENLERQVHQVLAALSRRSSSPVIVQARLVEISRSLLAPVAGQLGNKRLLFVPHGALQTLPFNALSDPSASDGAPLVLHHEVVVIPSASLLAALRQRAARRGQPAEAMALIGDPVISPEDPRAAPASRNTPGPLEGGALDLLSYARREIDAIAKLVPARNSTLSDHAALLLPSGP